MCDPLTSKDKLIASLSAGVLFFVLSSPFAYKATSSLGTSKPNGCPTMNGILIHGLVYMVILRMLMLRENRCTDKYSDKDKWMVSFIGGLLFILLSSPYSYRITSPIASSLGVNIQRNNCPNIVGQSLHAIVFAVIARLMM